MVCVRNLISIAQTSRPALLAVLGLTTITITLATQTLTAKAEFDHPMGEVYIENVATGRRINMNERQNGGRVMVMNKDDSSDQKLWLEGNADNYTFSIWVDNTYTRLSSKGSPTANGVQLEAWNSGKKGDPMQTIDAVARNGRPGEYLLTFVVNSKGTNQCIDGFPGNNNPKTWSLAYLWTCDNNNDNQAWRIISRKPIQQQPVQPTAPQTQAQALPSAKGYELIGKTITISSPVRGLTLKYDATVDNNPGFIADGGSRLFAQPKYTGNRQQQFKVVGCTAPNGFNTGIGLVQVDAGRVMNFRGDRSVTGSAIGSTTNIDPCHPHQNWDGHKLANGRWVFRHKSSNLVLDLARSGEMEMPINGKDNKIVVLWNYSGAENQQWEVNEVASVIQPPANSNGDLQGKRYVATIDGMGLNTWKAATGNFISNGSPIYFQLPINTGDTEMQTNFIGLNGGLGLQNQATGQCATFDNFNNGAKLVNRPCDGRNGQVFDAVKEDGKYIFVVKGTNFAISMDNGRGAQKAIHGWQLVSDGSRVNQKWVMNITASQLPEVKMYSTQWEVWFIARKYDSNKPLWDGPNVGHAWIALIPFQKTQVWQGVSLLRVEIGPADYKNIATFSKWPGGSHNNNGTDLDRTEQYLRNGIISNSVEVAARKAIVSETAANWVKSDAWKQTGCEDYIGDSLKPNNCVCTWQAGELWKIITGESIGSIPLIKSHPNELANSISTWNRVSGSQFTNNGKQIR